MTCSSNRDISDGRKEPCAGRRRFLAQTGGAILCGVAGTAAAKATSDPQPPDAVERQRTSAPRVRVFLCGDVMTGRGIDQILQHPGDPRIFEGYVRSAREYVAIAEQASGPVPRAVDPAYVWGDALAELERARLDARIVNLETAVTDSGDPWPGKGIHYRMHPANVSCLTAAQLDCCTLANNHVLDWGYAGLRQTLETLRGAGLRMAGAGRDSAEATAPAVIDVSGGRRVLVFAYASPSAGVPTDWAARPHRPGLNVLDEAAPGAVERVAREVGLWRRPGDLVVASLHWGGNWGYEVPAEQRTLAHRLIDDAGVDVIHGHSSHHPRPIEVHSNKLILYGCGDFINDYEGIAGHEAFRPELGLMYLPEFDSMTGQLTRLQLVATRIRRLRVERAATEDASWLQERLNREARAFGTRIEAQPGGRYQLQWT
jgi:poly-gamma-glutamate synthesis protein (capsule biosynthesis protein)